ncbi:HTH domain-containing protein [Polyangium sp. y55x31]|uniref:HTH domain-containing protein n=1 Tax=Polyangium sp. y55x31 TaxID=3042688 RepID=UPI00248329AA|nr:HTH domain-containing protein [Polyangium sp. y55x31]MDI1483950.1 HTH domain-containing protein [Polyangium sp. y55x31]
MTFTDAAAEVLRLVGRPLHYKEITDIAIEKNLLSHVGKSPEVTMGARLAAMLKKDSSDTPLIRVKPGVFALREWDEKTLRAGLDGKKGRRGGKQEPAKAARHEVEEEAAPEVAEEEEAETEAETEEAPEEIEAAPAAPEEAAPAAEEAADEDDETLVSPAPAKLSPPTPRPSAPTYTRAVEDEEDIDAGPAGPDDVMRAEAAAGAAEMFDEEEDDDQPILGGGDERAGGGAAEPGGEGRRRRRRRRRGRSTNGEAQALPTSGGGLPSYTATPAFEVRRDGRDRDRDRDVGRDRDRDRDIGRDREIVRDVAPTEAVYRGPQVIELTPGEGHPALDDLAGRELADAVAAILSTFDRNAGAVSLRQIAETAQRRGRLSGDAQLVQSQVAAAVRADNARRIAAGQRPRFRFAGGRVALTDWLLGGDLARLEQEALAAVERYRDAARRAFARKLGELPGHAFIEVCVLALERMGVGQLRAVRRAGAPGGESHFSGVLRMGNDEIRVAIVIRRDGREVGRERVTELRGSLHHYGPATVGWIFTAGQTLSGAREEASVPGTAPIALYDGLAVARLCEDNDVAVIRAKLPIAIPDVDLLDALRAS